MLHIIRFQVTKQTSPTYIKIAHEFFQIWYEEKFEVPPLNLSILRNIIP